MSFKLSPSHLASYLLNIFKKCYYLIPVLHSYIAHVFVHNMENSERWIALLYLFTKFYWIFIFVRDVWWPKYSFYHPINALHKNYIILNNFFTDLYHLACSQYDSCFSEFNIQCHEFQCFVRSGSHFNQFLWELYFILISAQRNNLSRHILSTS